MMYVCGYDVYVVILLSIVEVLLNIKEDFVGEICLFF